MSIDTQEKSLDIRVGGQSFTVTEQREMCADHVSFVPYYSLTTDIVCGMSRLSYHMPQFKQEVLDALSPFQIVSKLWAAGIIRNVADYEHSPDRIAFFGSWFGQQSALLSRQIRGYSNNEVFLVDKRKDACEAAEFLLRGDDKHSEGGNVKIVQQDALTWEFPAVNEKIAGFVNDLVVWNGIEHFDMLGVAEYINAHPKVAFCLQGTDLQDPDHINLVKSINDLIEILSDDRREQICYAGQIQCEFASRFMLFVLPEL